MSNNEVSYILRFFKQDKEVSEVIRKHKLNCKVYGFHAIEENVMFINIQDIYHDYKDTSLNDEDNDAVVSLVTSDIIKHEMLHYVLRQLKQYGYKYLIYEEVIVHKLCSYSRGS